MNRGLETASGSVVFRDSEGQILAEQTFEDLGYGGVAIADYMPESFSALYGQDITATVKLDQQESDLLNNTATVPVLAAETEITAAYWNENEIGAEIVSMQDVTVLCAYYDPDGRMLGVRTQTVPSGKGQTLALEVPYSSAARVKILLLDEHYVPVCGCVSVERS